MPCRPWQASPEARAPAAHGHRGLAYQESTCIRCRPFRTSPGCTLFSSDPRTVMGPPVGGRFVSWVQPGDRPHTRCGTMRCRPPSWHSHDPSCMLLFVEVRARPICCIPVFAGPEWHASMYYQHQAALHPLHQSGTEVGKPTMPICIWAHRKGAYQYWSMMQTRGACQ